MKHLLLQTTAPVESIQTYLLQYGLLGIIAIVLAYIAWSQYQKLVERNDTLEAKVDKLQEEMNSLLIEERDRMSKLVEDNTKALSELHRTIMTFMLSNKQ
jgi:predicted PurR-regulated permease PerM